AREKEGRFAFPSPALPGSGAEGLLSARRKADTPSDTSAGLYGGVGATATPAAPSGSVLSRGCVPAPHSLWHGGTQLSVGGANLIGTMPNGGKVLCHAVAQNSLRLAL